MNLRKEPLTFSVHGFYFRFSTFSAFQYKGNLVDTIANVISDIDM